MTGTVAQIISLVSYGNDYLINNNLPPDFYRSNTTFQFCKEVDFRIFQKSFLFGRIKEQIVADTPHNWFEHLKSNGCKKLRVAFQNSKNESLPDYKLAGFVGRGGEWIIESVYGNHSDSWINNWDVTDKDNPDNKIWSVKYGLTVKNRPTLNIQIDINATRISLKQILIEIADFAYKQNFQGFGAQFDNAVKVLDYTEPNIHIYHKDLIPLHNYTLAAQQLLFAANSAWVFGGMGSWNDIWLEDESGYALYESLSARLYVAINNSIIATVNSF